jgi:ribonuclease HI
VPPIQALHDPLKCAFGVVAGKFLRFLVHQRGIDVDPMKAKAIATMKPPTTVKELKSFLGKLSYIRRFILGLAAVTTTFTPLLKKGVKYEWTDERQQTFQQLQRVMANLPTVKAPFPGVSLQLYLASNDKAIRVLVAQEDKEGVEQPIYYVSRALRDAETRYARAELACLSLVYATQKLRHYFMAHTVHLMTKSHPIRTLLRRPVLSGRLAQWLLQLSEYEIVPITPKAIKSQAIADLLAQFPGEDASSTNDEVPGEVGEVAFAEISDAVWTLRFDGSFTVFGGGAGVVLTREGGDTLSMSFKLDFPCSNNAAEYEAYLTGLALARELRIKRLKVRGDSNLVVSQAKGDFALREPSLALYRAMAQRLEDYFEELTIEHTQRSDNRHADALATLGSKSIFDGKSTNVTILKRSSPITQLLHEEFAVEPPQEEDWRLPLKESLTNPERSAKLTDFKDYTLVAGELYRRLLGGVLARCMSSEEVKKKLAEVHERTCCLKNPVPLYRRLQRIGYYWPEMRAQASEIQSSCSRCQHIFGKEEAYATFSTSDWRTPFLEYLLENILPETSKEAHHLKQLAHRYFTEGGILFRKGFHGEPLRCLGLAESQIIMKEIHGGKCEDHQGRKKLHQQLLISGYFWPSMKRDAAEFVKSCHTCQVHSNLIHTHPTSLQNMTTPWPFHTWGLDLIGPINPPSNGCIWILVATEYFTKWVEAIPLKKATGAAVVNFIREHIMCRFGIPHRIISDNGTPFINKDV